tara:strand:+ start:870 stop:1109 length:240 start_codon:yes stop_codon:yes gene_type:complete
MTSVNVTTIKNNVTVDEGDTTVVSVITPGPQGGNFSVTGISLDDSEKVNNSIVYFSQSDGKFKADASRTVENLVDGGNF